MFPFRRFCLEELPFRPPEVWHGCRMSFHFQGVSYVLTQSRDGLFRSYDKRMDFVFRRMGVV